MDKAAEELLEVPEDEEMTEEEEDEELMLEDEEPEPHEARAEVDIARRANNLTVPDNLII